MAKKSPLVAVMRAAERVDLEPLPDASDYDLELACLSDQMFLNIVAIRTTRDDKLLEGIADFEIAVANSSRPEITPILQSMLDRLNAMKVQRGL